jgi:hypothetical protein
MPERTDAELEQLMRDIGLTPPPAAEKPDPYAGVRALAAAHDKAYGAVLGKGLGRPRRPYRRAAGR